MVYIKKKFKKKRKKLSVPLDSTNQPIKKKKNNLYFLATPSGMQDLSYLTRNRTHAPCIEVWSLNHWTTRDVPYIANSDWNIKRHKVCCFCPHAVFIPSGSGDRGFRSTAHRCHRLPLRLPALGRIPDH